MRVKAGVSQTVGAQAIKIELSHCKVMLRNWNLTIRNWKVMLKNWNLTINQLINALLAQPSPALPSSGVSLY